MPAAIPAPHAAAASATSRPAAAGAPPGIMTGIRSMQYYFYRAFTRMNEAIRSRIRPAGVGLLLSLLMVTFVAAGNAETPVYQLFCLGLALLLAGLAWLPFRTARVVVRRELPSHATAGVPLHYCLQVRNPGRGSLHAISFAETPPDSRPGRQTFLQRAEPGEAEWNMVDRFFAWYRWSWLCQTGRAFVQEKPSAPADLKGRATAEIPMQLVPSRRGRIPLRDLRVLVPDPLGLFQRRIRANAPADFLVVLPRRYPLPPFELPGSARFQPGSDATSRTSGQSGEFSGLREYQPGDPLRLIHWATWARTGRPVVKELEDTFFPRHGLVLDTFPGPADGDLFEDAVAVAASFIVAADTQEALIDLMFIAGQDRVITAGHGVGPSHTLLEVLAGTEAAEKEDFPSLARLVTRHAEDMAGCLCVFAGWSASRAEFLGRLAAAGMECAALVICPEKPPGLPPRCHHLRPASLAADLMLLPAHL